MPRVMDYQRKPPQLTRLCWHRSVNSDATSSKEDGKLGSGKTVTIAKTHLDICQSDIMGSCHTDHKCYRAIIYASEFTPAIKSR